MVIGDKIIDSFYFFIGCLKIKPNMLNNFIDIFKYVQSLNEIDQPIWYSWYYTGGEPQLFHSLLEGIKKYYYIYNIKHKYIAFIIF